MPKAETSTGSKDPARPDPCTQRGAAIEMGGIEKSSQKEKSPTLAEELPTDQSRGEGQTRRPLLLDLPAEVRLQIYGLFASIPAATADEADSLERCKIIRARYSLQLTCRQINREWSPLFYATTTIVLHGLSIASDDGFPEDRLSLDRSPQDFARNFLCARPKETLRQIRRLAWNCRWRPSRSSLARDFEYLFNSLNIYRNFLESLEEIAATRYVFEVAFIRDVVSWRVEDGEIFWRAAESGLMGLTWKWVERCFFDEPGRNRYCREWSSARQMHIATIECGPQLPYLMKVVQSQLVFRKGVKPLAPLADGWVEISGRAPRA